MLTSIVCLYLLFLIDVLKQMNLLNVLILRKGMLKYLEVNCHIFNLFSKGKNDVGENEIGSKCGKMLLIVESRWRVYRYLLYYSSTFL